MVIQPRVRQEFGQMQQGAAGRIGGESRIPQIRCAQQSLYS